MWQPESVELRSLLERQRGVLSRQQAVRLGVPPTLIDSQLRWGRWTRLQQGVYSTFTGSPSRAALQWSALLRAGSAAVLSHRTAAELQGLTDRGSSPIHGICRCRPAGNAHPRRAAAPFACFIRHGAPERIAAAHPGRGHGAGSGPVRRDLRRCLRLALPGRRPTPDDHRAATRGNGLPVPAALAPRPGCRARRYPGRRSLTTRAPLRREGGACPRASCSSSSGRHSCRRASPVHRQSLRGCCAGGGTRRPGGAPAGAALGRQSPGQRARRRRITTLHYNWHDVSEGACRTAAEVASVLASRGTAVKLRSCGPGCSAFLTGGAG
jgi:hypothetical protein